MHCILCRHTQHKWNVWVKLQRPRSYFCLRRSVLSVSSGWWPGHNVCGGAAMSLHVTEARDIKNTALNVIRCQTEKSKRRGVLNIALRVSEIVTVSQVPRYFLFDMICNERCKVHYWPLLHPATSTSQIKSQVFSSAPHNEHLGKLEN